MRVSGVFHMSCSCRLPPLQYVHEPWSRVKTEHCCRPMKGQNTFLPHKQNAYGKTSDCLKPTSALARPVSLTLVSGAISASPPAPSLCTRVRRQPLTVAENVPSAWLLLDWPGAASIPLYMFFFPVLCAAQQQPNLCCRYSTCDNGLETMQQIKHSRQVFII